MSIQNIAINSFASFIVGGTIFKKVKDIVDIYNNSTLTNEEKRLSAIKDAEDIGLGLAGWVLNLAIELAVAYFKTVIV